MKCKRRETSGSQLTGWGCCLIKKPPGVEPLLDKATWSGVNALEEEGQMLIEGATLMLG